MRFVTDEELDNLLPGSKFGWFSREITTHTHDSGRRYSLPLIEQSEKLMFQCLRCKAHYLHEECGNCGSDQLETAQGGIFCKQCEKGFTDWTCEKCGTENPARKTLFLIKKEGGCFIATAACGSPYADEVVWLSRFRDEILELSRAGRVFISLYYATSPPLAKVVSRFRIFRGLAALLLVRPLAAAARRYLTRMR